MCAIVYIFFCCYPFKVIPSVILLIFVLMVDLCPIKITRHKRLCNFTMHTNIFLISRKTYKVITIWMSK